MNGAIQKSISIALRGGVAAFALALCIHGSTKRPAKIAALPSAAQSAASATKRTSVTVAAVPGIPDPPAPIGTAAATNWWRRGAWSDWRRIDFPSGWSFPCGTGRVTSVALLARGAVLLGIRATNALAEVGVPLSLAPLDSVCWYGLSPSNSYAFGWSRAYANRDANAPTDARIELFRNGDSAVTLNGATTYRRHVLPFGHDGIGQDAEWIAANFTNAAEIASVGYPQWVAGRVNAVRGLYRLRVTFAAPPPEDVLLTVGKYRVLVREAGAYDFLLEKGVRHAVALSFVPDGVSYSWDDGGAAEAAAQSAADLPSQTLEFVAEGATGRTMFEPPEGADAEGFILWIPTLSVYAGSPKYGFPVRFWTFADLPPGCPYDVAWKSDDGSVTGTGDGIWIYEPVTWETVTATLRYPDGRIAGRVTARRFVAETRLALAAPKAVVFERAYTNAPGEVVPMRSSALRATAAWATAEAGTVRLSCEPTGAFAAVADGIRTPLPCEWASAKDAADSREIVLDGRSALAEAGDAARLTLTFEPDGGGAAIEESAEIRAYELKVETASDWPTNKIRHVFGPLEKFRIVTTPACSVEPVGESGLEKLGDGLFRVPVAAGNGLSRLSVGGVDYDFPYSVVHPNGIRTEFGRILTTADVVWGGGCLDAGFVGLGFCVDVYMMPDFVSFAELSVMERGQPAVEVDGAFGDEDFFPSECLDHSMNGSDVWHSVGGENRVYTDEMVLCLGPFAEARGKSGHFRWRIPAIWTVSDALTPTNTLPWSDQEFWLFANGDVRMEKFGWSVTRTVNGSISTNFVEGAIR